MNVVSHSYMGILLKRFMGTIISAPPFRYFTASIDSSISGHSIVTIISETGCGNEVNGI